MSDEADIGHGILFKRETAAGSGIYETIPGLTVPKVPGLSRDMVDSTDTESADRFRRFVPGLSRADELPLEFEQLPGNAIQQKLYTDFHSRDIVNYQIVGNDDANTTWNFSGHVSAIDPTTPLDDKKTISVTITISGKPTLT